MVASRPNIFYPEIHVGNGCSLYSINQEMYMAPLVKNFDFFPKPFFQNLSSPSWGVAFLRVQFICHCLQYIHVHFIDSHSSNRAYTVIDSFYVSLISLLEVISRNLVCLWLLKVTLIK